MFEVKAQQGVAEAQFLLGEMYELGRGVVQDYIDSFRWYLPAAEQGHPHAQFVIAYHYEWGLGVPKDLSVAAKWYQLSAQNGDASAIQRLDQFANERLGDLKGST